MNNENKDINIDIDIRNRRIKALKKRYVIRSINLIGVIVFSVSILTVAIFLLILNRPEISETENRTLAKFPSFSVEDYFSGKYTADIEEFYNDTVPGREVLKDVVADIKSCFGIKSDDGVKIHGDILIMEEEEQPEITTVVTSKEIGGTTSISVSQTKEADPLDDPNIEGEISNSILVYNNRGIMLYGGSKSNAELYAQYVNNFKADLGEDVNVYSMICPTPVSYYLPSKYADMTNSEKKNIAHVNKHLDGVIPVDAWGALNEHKDEKIFQNTDHHWAQLGAYYACEKFADVADVPFADLSEYEKIVREGYVGTLYGYTGDNDLKDNPEEFIYYKPKCEYQTEYFSTDLLKNWEGSLVLNTDNIATSSWYCVFIGTDDVVTHVTTSVKNGRKLAVIKDSYGNATIPCLTSSFEEIYVIDMRYFEKNAISYFKEKGITDVLFAMNTFSATGSNFEHIERIRTQ